MKKSIIFIQIRKSKKISPKTEKIFTKFYQNIVRFDKIVTFVNILHKYKIFSTTLHSYIQKQHSLQNPYRTHQ